MFDFFDFNLLGFIIAFVSGAWHLTGGQAAIILGTSGLGVIIGGFIWGRIGDRVGRRLVLIYSVLIYSLGSALMAATPEGSWQFLSILRIFVGFGVAGAFTIAFPLVSEFVPTSRRGFYIGLVATFVPVGTLIASAGAAFLVEYLGWRGLALVSGLPALLVILLHAFIPESPRWLASKGRIDEARRVIGKILYVNPESVTLDVPSEGVGKPAKWVDVFRYPRSLISSWLVNIGLQGGSYTFTLWGPALLVLIMHVDAKTAAFLFIFVALAGFLGRASFDFLIEILGRKVSGYIVSFGSAIVLLMCGLFHDAFIGGISVFYILAMVAYFLIDGTWPVTTSLGSEIWPQVIRSSGWGSSYGFGGLGKIIGPIGLGLLIGAGMELSPRASLAGVIPAFTFLALIMAMAGVGFAIAFETKKRSLEEIDKQLAVVQLQRTPPRSRNLKSNR
jgi:putative MFS transporter